MGASTSSCICSSPSPLPVQHQVWPQGLKTLELIDQICALAEAIAMEKLSPTGDPAHCVLSKQRELQGVNGHWRSLDPSLVARLAGDQLMRLVSALHMLVEVLNRVKARLTRMREGPSLLKSGRRISNKAVLLLQQALDAHQAFLVAFKMALAASVGAPPETGTAARPPAPRSVPAAPAAAHLQEVQGHPVPPSQPPPAQPTSTRKARSSRSTKSGRSSRSSEHEYLGEPLSPEPSYQEPPPAIQSDSPVKRGTTGPRPPAQPHILGVRRSYISTAAAVAAAATQTPVQLPTYVLMPVHLAVTPAASVVSTSRLQAEASSASTASHLVAQSAPQSTAVLAPHWQLLPAAAAVGVTGTPFVGKPPRHALSASLPSVTSQQARSTSTPTRSVPAAATAATSTTPGTTSPGATESHVLVYPAPSTSASTPVTPSAGFLVPASELTPGLLTRLREAGLLVSSPTTATSTTTTSTAAASSVAMGAPGNGGAAGLVTPGPSSCVTPVKTCPGAQAAGPSTAQPHQVYLTAGTAYQVFGGHHNSRVPTPPSPPSPPVAPMPAPSPPSTASPSYGVRTPSRRFHLSSTPLFEGDTLQDTGLAPSTAPSSQPQGHGISAELAQVQQQRKRIRAKRQLLDTQGDGDPFSDAYLPSPPTHQGLLPASNQPGSPVPQPQPVGQAQVWVVPQAAAAAAGQVPEQLAQQGHVQGTMIGSRPEPQHTAQQGTDAPASGVDTTMPPGSGQSLLHGAQGEQGPLAMAVLGQMLRSSDPPTAWRLLLAAAQEGAACTWLGEMCEQGVGQHAGSQQQQQQQQQQATGGTQPPSTSSRDSLLSEAVDWYRKGLALGDPQSAAHLGYLLEQGVGVPQPDLPAAAEAYRRAAAGGVATAANNLATMYMRGRGVPKDKAAALRLYEQAASAGSATAAYNLATALLASSRKALRRQASQQKRSAELPAAAHQGAGNHGSGFSGLAAAVLGTEGTGEADMSGQAQQCPPSLGLAVLNMLTAGQPASSCSADGAIDQQTARAMWWLQQAASAGHTGATLLLGQLLARLPGCAGAAITHLRSAAVQGSSRAMLDLAEHLEQLAHSLAVGGDGSPVLACDTRLGELLVNLKDLVPPPVAGSKDGDRSHRSLGLAGLAAGLNTGERCYLAAGRWYARAADAGEPRAQHWVGNSLWDSGRRDQAATWWFKAARRGHAPSHMVLGHMMEGLWGGQTDMTAAMAHYKQAQALGFADAKSHIKRLKDQQKQRQPLMSAGVLNSASTPGRSQPASAPAGLHSSQHLPEGRSSGAPARHQARSSAVPLDGIAAAAEGSLRRLMRAVTEVMAEGQGLRYSDGQDQGSQTPAGRGAGVLGGSRPSCKGNSRPAMWWQSGSAGHDSSLNLQPSGLKTRSQAAGRYQGWNSMLEPIYEGTSLLGTQTRSSSDRSHTLPLPLGLHSALFG